MELSPLVEPASSLDPEESRRYARHLVLPGIGGTGQRRLRAARVLVIGAGGLGSPALLYLAAAGVGTIGIVDPDVVDETNLQRQVIHGQDDVGRPKADSARDGVLAVNPRLQVRTHPVLLGTGNALDLMSGYDLVLDGTDNFPSRYLIGDACELLGLPEVWGAVHRFDGQVGVFWAGRGPVYRDLFPTPPPPGAVPSCAEGGVLGVLCGAIGSVMAAEAVKLICGIGEPLLGRLLVFDALAMTWRTVQVGPDPDRPPVTGLGDDGEFCGFPAAGAGRETGGAVGEVGEVGEGIDAPTLRAMLAARERGERDFVLIDLREPGERVAVAVPGSVPVPMDRFLSGRVLSELPADRSVVLYCTSGVRSAQALAVLRAAGRADAVHLAGGVLAWMRDIGASPPA